MSTPPATARAGPRTVTGTGGAAVTVVPRPISPGATAPPQYWESGESYVATFGSPAWASRKHPSQTASIDWDSVVREITSPVTTIWDSARLQHLLAQPLGAPVDLTDEEAEEIVRLAAGRRPDLPPGRDYVRYVRALFGHSILGRRKGGR